ncbi:MAG TPA: hypothetical protein VMZ24_01200 [Patescibacteria group bacterium]|nr:hypothetical protein [Patescibacteria group bacterium]
MARTQPTDENLRAQIEAASASHYPVTPIEDRIATSLVDSGSFHGFLNAKELALILRNLVYVIFSQQQIGGRGVKLIHNVPNMKIAIKNQQADVSFLVHIHKPIIAFISFSYSLLNDPVSAGRNLRMKHGSLKITQDTRRFDLKAKAALAAVDIDGLARRELADPAAIIVSTLPHQLQKRAVRGEVKSIELCLHEHYLEVGLKGKFESTGDE